MIGVSDSYYNLPELSNSDLTKVKMLFADEQFVRDSTEAFRFGNLVDAMITESHRCDYYSLKVDDEQCYFDEWELAKRMKQSFLSDPECATLLKISKTQHVSFQRNVELEFEGTKFTVNRRCKWDGFIKPTNWGWDLKSTAATSQKEFEAACRHFDYHRSRAWYMDIVGSDKDLIIGVSKKNFKIFKVRIKRNDDFYNEGRAQYSELAFRWWTLLGGVTI